MTRLVAAARPDWPIHRDHCFLRVAYDNACGARWDSLVRRPAWQHLPDAALDAALRHLGAMADLDTLRELNRLSLAMRHGTGVPPSRR